MKRWHVRTTYSAYSTLVKIYKLVSGFDLLCVGRWLPRRAILSGTGTVTYACTSVVLLGIISPCDGYLLLVYLKATSVHLSSCQTTCDCLPHAMDVCSLFISTPLACICHPARQLVTRPLHCSNEGKWHKDCFVHFNSTKVSRLLRKHIPGTPPDSAALTDPKPTDPGGSLSDGRRKSFRAASGDHDYDKCIYVKNIPPKRCTQLPHLSAVLAFITWPMRFSYSHYSQYLSLLSKAKRELNTI